MADYGLRIGTPEIASLGPITFGPDDILFLADNVRAVVYAVELPAHEAPPAETFELDDVDTKLAGMLGCTTEDVVIADMAVHPRSGNIFLSVMRGRGAAALPVLVEVDQHDGAIREVALEGVPYAEVSISNAPGEDDPRTDTLLPDAPDGEEIELGGHKLRVARPPARTSTVTDMAYVDGVLFVAGLSNEEFASNLRRIAFPFSGDVLDNSLEIFHVSHGRFETHAPIRKFLPYEGGRSILASYTCTPLVQFSLDDLTSGSKVDGKTVAELGARSQPLDMIGFSQADGEYLLICHSANPLMKLSFREIESQDALTEPKEPRGVTRHVIDIAGIKLLANLNMDNVLALQRDESGARHLRSLKTAAL
jgi:hypothetical protein